MDREIESLNLEISDLKTRTSLYWQKFDDCPDSSKTELLQLLREVENHCVELQKQKTTLIQRSRSTKPMSVDLPKSPSEENDIERMKNYVYLVDGVIACATALDTNILASCYHCVKHCVTSGPDVDELQSHRNAVVGLTHAVTNQKIKAKICAYSIEKDVVLLQTDENMKVDELGFREAYLGQPYFLLGTLISDDGNPLQVLSGRISSTFERNLMSSGHSLHGHGSARPEASGGPVFARKLCDGKLTILGIVVGGQNISNETTLGTFVSSNYVKIIAYMTLRDTCVLWKAGFFKL